MTLPLNFKERVRSALLKRIEAGKSAASIAREADVNAAYLTTIREGRHDNHSGSPVPDNVYRKLAQSLGVDQDTVETHAYRAIMTRLKEAKAGQEACVIDAPTGAGKTHACQAFRREQGSGTYLVTCSADMTPWGFFTELARQVGATLDTKSPGVRDLRLAVEAKLLKDNFPMVIIDEAENLKPAMYAALKAMYDSTRWQAAIVLVGTNNYYAWLGKKATKVEATSVFPQMWRRFRTAPLLLQPYDKADLSLVLDTYGVNERQERNALGQGLESLSDLFEMLNKNKRDARWAVK